MDAAGGNGFALRLLVVSALLGLVGDALLSNETWGLSLPLFMTALVGQVWLISRQPGRSLPADAMRLLLLALGFSVLFAWRDAPELKLLNGGVVFSLVGLALLRTIRGDRPLGIGDIFARALSQWVALIGDFCSLVFKDVRWAETARSKATPGTHAIARGIVIALPLLVVFGSLLASADASFERLLSNLADVDAEIVSTHIAISALCAIVCGGFLRRLFISRTIARPPKPFVPFVLAPHHHPPYRSADSFQLGSTEYGIVLGSLNLLFAAFVALQAHYLFGGGSHVVETAGLTYAEYARRGFFELVWVIALALPVLLGSYRLMKPDSVAAQRVWRSLAVVMVCQLFVVMHSAVDRMRLYVEFYDLSTLRVYVLAALGFLGAALLVFLATAARGQYQRFAAGALGCALIGTLTVNLVNPDALVVRHNLSKVGPGRSVDEEYLLGLSADAIPHLVRLRSKLTASTQRELDSKIQLDRASWDNWRSWNLSRSAALSAAGKSGAVAARVTDQP